MECYKNERVLVRHVFCLAEEIVRYHNIVFNIERMVVVYYGTQERKVNEVGRKYLESLKPMKVWGTGFKVCSYDFVVVQEEAQWSK